MANIPFVIERKVQYHGIWNIGLQLTDEFTKKIANEHDKRKPCPAFITLSSTSFSLVALSRDNQKELHRHSVDFESLRDVAVNAYNKICLMILFINPKNRYSLIVCACRDEKEAVSISLAFKQLKNIKMMKQHEDIQQNWILRKNSLRQNSDESNGDNESTTRGRTMSGIMNENFAFLSNEDDSSYLGDADEIFEEVDREPARRNGDEIVSYHTGIQVNLYDNADSVSLNSQTSFVSMQSLRNELSVVENGNPAPSEIGKEEYYKAVPMDKHVNGRPDGDDKNNNEHRHTADLVRTNAEDSPALRSVGTMTDSLNSGNSKRYKKRPGSMGSSNVYKMMAAQRKQNSISPQTSPTVNVPVAISPSVSVPSVMTSTTFTPAEPNVFAQAFVPPGQDPAKANFLRARPASYHAPPGSNGQTLPSRVRYNSLFLPRKIQSGTTSVVRPIESVYQTFSKGARTNNPRRSRKKIIYIQADRPGVPTQ